MTEVGPVVEAGTNPGTDSVAVAVCEFPGGCSNPLDYAGIGRKPRYCGLTVNAVAHTRYNAHRINQGLLKLPAPGHRPVLDTASPSAAARPVSLARATIVALHKDIVATLTGHQDVLGELVSRLTDSLATATDPDATVAEVAAAHRDARARVDAAEAAEQDAHAQTRAAVAEAQTAQSAQAAAEQAAEQALIDTDDAADRAAAAEQAHSTLAEHLAQVEHDLSVRSSERDQLTARLAQRDGELSAAHIDLDAHRRRADDAEREVDRTAVAAEALREQLIDVRAQLNAATTRADQHAVDLATAREQLAETRAQLAGAHAAIGEEKTHSAQRLTDTRDAYEARLATLQARLLASGHGTHDDDPDEVGRQDRDPADAASRSGSRPGQRSHRPDQRSPR